MAHDGRFQRGQVHAFARMGGNFDGLQSQALQRLQRRIESRRLDQHGVSGLGHG